MCHSVMNHSKGSVVWSISKKLVIQVIRNSSEKDSKRHEDRNFIRNKEKRFLLFPRKKNQSDSDSENSPVKAHSTLIHCENLGRMREIVRKIVPKDISEPSSEDDTGHHRVEKDIKLSLGKPLAGMNPSVCTEYPYGVRKAIVGRSDCYSE